MPGPLTPDHLAMLTEGSGIALDVITERGYRTCTGYSELKSLGIAISRSMEPTGVLMPLCAVDGTPATHFLAKENRPVPYTVFRPDRPGISPDGRERKYLNPKSSHPRLDTHSRCLPAVRDPSGLLWVTEGMKKGDALVSQGACAIALLGVECWRVPDWQDVPLQGRPVGIVFDSDVMTKAEVQKALGALTAYLTYKGAVVQHVYLPSTPGTKMGVDDYLLSKTLADLEALLEPPRGRKKAPSVPAGDWRAGLLMTEHGRPQETYGNLRLCAAHGKDSAHLWYDAVADRPMVGDAPLSDALVEQAAAAIERGIRIPIRNLRLVRTALVAQCREKIRDPIREWLERLPAWDGITRLPTWLVEYAGA